MAGLLSGLEQFGLSNLESMDLFEAPKKRRRRRRRRAGDSYCAGAGFSF